MLRNCAFLIFLAISISVRAQQITVIAAFNEREEIKWPV